MSHLEKSMRTVVVFRRRFDGRCVIVGSPRNTVPAHMALLLAPKNSYGSALVRKSVRPTTYTTHTSGADGVRPPYAK